VTRNNSVAFMGNIYGDIDLADMSALTGPTSTFAGALAHEVAEQMVLQSRQPRPRKNELSVAPDRPSHLAGIAAQSAAVGRTRVNPPLLDTRNRLGTGATAIQFGYGRDARTVRIEWRNGNVVKVDQ